MSWNTQGTFKGDHSQEKVHMIYTANIHYKLLPYKGLIGRFAFCDVLPLFTFIFYISIFIYIQLFSF